MVYSTTVQTADPSGAPGCIVGFELLGH